MNEHGPETLIEAVRYFADPDQCHAYMRELKWPEGSKCPKCGHDQLTEVKTRRLIRCKACRKQFSAKVGTIFEDSPLGLDKWFVGVWYIANCKNGASSSELARALGITQKSAWFVLHRIRAAMRGKTFRRLAGVVESDETYVGGKAANMHARRREEVIRGRGNAAEERPSQVRCAVVPNTEADTLVPEIA